MNGKLLKSKKGITLIALVVTIVVLLILAAVSMAMLGGENGIITQAKYAKEKTRAGTVEERRDLWKTENQINEEKIPRSKILEELQNENLLTEEEVREIEETGQVTIADRVIEFKDDINLNIEVQLNYLEINPIKCIMIEVKSPELTEDILNNIVNLRKNYITTLNKEEKIQELIKVFNSIIVGAYGTIPYAKTESELVKTLCQQMYEEEKNYTTMEELYNAEYKEEYNTYEDFLNNFYYDSFGAEAMTYIGIFDIYITKPDGEIINLYSIPPDSSGDEYAQAIFNLESGEYKVSAKLFGTDCVGSNSIIIDENTNNYEFITDKYYSEGYIHEPLSDTLLEIDEAYVYIGNEKINVSNYIYPKDSYDYINLSEIFSNVVNYNVPYDIELITNGKTVKGTITHSPIVH